jgi:hypothetical protein
MVDLITQGMSYVAIWLKRTLSPYRGAIGDDAPFRVIYVIWFMCVIWITIVLSTNMVMHDNYHECLIT